MQCRSLALPLVLGLLAAAPLAQAAPPLFRLDPAKSVLAFSFTQAGASNKGRFGKFDTSLVFDPAQLAASRLEVTVQIASLDTGDKDRDSTLRGAELFDAAKFATAHFLATRITRLDASHYQASGKLTIRDAMRELSVPFTLQTTPVGGQTLASMAGEVIIKRLDYGVGQGDWKSTEWVGNEVSVSFNLALHAP